MTLCAACPGAGAREFFDRPMPGTASVAKKRKTERGKAHGCELAMGAAPRGVVRFGGAEPPGNQVNRANQAM